MPVREALLALFLTVAGCLVVVGVARMHEPSAFVSGGVIIGALGLLFLTEAAD